MSEPAAPRMIAVYLPGISEILDLTRPQPF